MQFVFHYKCWELNNLKLLLPNDKRYATLCNVLYFVSFLLYPERGGIMIFHIKPESRNNIVSLKWTDFIVDSGIGLCWHEHFFYKVVSSDIIWCLPQSLKINILYHQIDYNHMFPNFISGTFCFLYSFLGSIIIWFLFIVFVVFFFCFLFWYFFQRVFSNT